MFGGMEEAKEDGTEEVAGAEMVGDIVVKSRHIDDTTVRDWNEDRSSWTRSIRCLSVANITIFYRLLLAKEERKLLASFSSKIHLSRWKNRHLRKRKVT